MPKKSKTTIQVFIRPSMPAGEVTAFQSACKDVGETMTSITRRMISKVAAGDTELLQRIRS
jgi:hypothetical protein